MGGSDRQNVITITPYKSSSGVAGESMDETASLYPRLDRQSTTTTSNITPSRQQSSSLVPPSSTRGKKQLTQDDRDACPILRRVGYSTLPALSELATYTRTELESVPNFTIIHESMGRISWEGMTDVTDLNLDEIVFFERSEKTGAVGVEVYPLGSDLPPPGSKLNKPAVITVKQCWPAGFNPRATLDTQQSDLWAKRLTKYERKLRETTTRAGAEFLKYDPMKGEWCFRVESFS